jgi:apolipoprotein D and lipocalin family protein
VKRYTPKGRVHDETTNAEWRMQFLWPFESAYLIVYLDPDYRRTIIGVPDRDYVWLLSRDAELDEAEYQRLVGEAERLGYDAAEIRRVPQRWPGD